MLDMGFHISKQEMRIIKPDKTSPLNLTKIGGKDGEERMKCSQIVLLAFALERCPVLTGFTESINEIEDTQNNGLLPALLIFCPFTISSMIIVC